MSAGTARHWSCKTRFMVLAVGLSRARPVEQDALGSVLDLAHPGRSRLQQKRRGHGVSDLVPRWASARSGHAKVPAPREPSSYQKGALRRGLRAAHGPQKQGSPSRHTMVSDDERKADASPEPQQTVTIDLGPRLTLYRAAQGKKLEEMEEAGVSADTINSQRQWITYLDKVIYNDDHVDAADIRRIQQLAEIQLDMAGDVNNLDNEDRLYLEAIAGRKPKVASCDLESISNLGKAKDALEEAEKAIAIERGRAVKKSEEEEAAFKALGEKPEEEVPFNPGQDGINMASPMISCSLIIGRLVLVLLNNKARLIFEEIVVEGEPRMFVFKPRSFVDRKPRGKTERERQDDRVGFRPQDRIFVDTIKQGQQWSVRHFGIICRAKVLGSLGLLGERLPSGFYAKCKPWMEYSQRHNALRKAMIRLAERCDHGEMDDVTYGDELVFKGWYTRRMARVKFGLWRLSSNEPGASSFRMSSDAKVIACTWEIGVQDASTYKRSLDSVCQVSKLVVNMGSIWKKNFRQFDDELNTRERRAFKVPSNLNNDTPGGSVGAAFYNFLDECGLKDRETFLSKSVLLNCVQEKFLHFKRMGDGRSFTTADHLLDLTYDELKEILHICLVDAAVTMDNVLMMYGIMLDDERYVDMPDEERYDMSFDAEGDSDAEEQPSSQEDDPGLAAALAESATEAAAGEDADLAQALAASMTTS